MVAADLPPEVQFMRAVHSMLRNISYYDRTGKVMLWQDYNAVKRIPVPSGQISPYMKDATVAS